MSVEDIIELEPDPAEIDPLTCEQCGCVIEDLEELIHLRAADLVTRWELADPRDAWRHTGDLAPPVSAQNADICAKPANAPRPYRPTQSTVDAFRHLTTAGDVGRIREWLADRPQDAPHLLAFLEGQDHA
jgi:hypothetical protein